MSQLVTFTKAAEDHIARIMNMDAAKEAVGIRLEIPTKGCSGLSYKMDFVKDEIPGDEIVYLDNGHIVYVDPLATMYILGTEIDYDTSDKLAPGFRFNNPLATGTCGCGESFTIQEEQGPFFLFRA